MNRVKHKLHLAGDRIAVDRMEPGSHPEAAGYHMTPAGHTAIAGVDRIADRMMIETAARIDPTWVAACTAEIAVRMKTANSADHTVKGLADRAVCHIV